MVAIILPTLTILLSSFLYYGSNLLLTLYYNSPSRLQKINEFGKFEIQFQDVLRNCEDIHLDKLEGFALISCDPGRDEWNTVMGTFTNPISPPSTGIYLYNYTEQATIPIQLTFSPLKTTPFHPLGIEYHPESHTLFIINHAPPHATLEIYTLAPQTHTLTFQQKIQDPNHLHTPNSLAARSSTGTRELFITNDHFFRATTNPFLSKLESYTAFPGGSITWLKFTNSTGTPPQMKTLLHLPFANGIVLMDNDTTLAVVSSTTSSVRLYDISRPQEGEEEGVPTLTFKKSFPVPFIPDNISLDSQGRLLIAGHPHAPSLEILARNNGACFKDLELEEERVCRAHRLSWVVEWSELEGLKTLFSGGEFGSSSTAVRDSGRGVGFVTGLYHRGLMVWRE